MAEPLVFQDFVELSEIDSTNAYIENLLDTDPELASFCVLADFQTRGIGHGGNHWESDAGMNSLFSLYVSDVGIPAGRQFLISKIACLSIRDVLSKYIDPKRITIKWPNDIYIDDSKIAGILIKHRVLNQEVATSIIGVGININQEEFHSSAPNPISLKYYCFEEMSPKSIVKAVAERFTEWWTELQDGNEDEIDQIFHQCLFSLNTGKKYLHQDKEVQGIVRGVDEYGRLMLEINSTVLYADFKEVQLIL